MEHFSPEEKLLKLIRKAHRPAAAVGVKPKGLSWGMAFGHEEYQLFRRLENFFMLIIAGIFFYIGYQFLFTGKSPETAIEEAPGSSQPTPFEKIVIAEPKPSTYYTDPIRERNIFGASSGAPAVTAASMPELTRNLKLVGILLGKIPEVVIEDTEQKQTFFLKKGQAFKNAVIEEILEKKVILLVGGQRVELTTQ